MPQPPFKKCRLLMLKNLGVHGYDIGSVFFKLFSKNTKYLHYLGIKFFSFLIS